MSHPIPPILIRPSADVPRPTPKQSPQVKAWDAPDISAIRRVNKEAGLFWFRPDSMRYFQSKVHRYFGNGVFTTSEKSSFGNDSKRRFSVRVADSQGQVHTFGDFLAFERCGQATSAAHRLSVNLAEGAEVMDSNGQTYVRLGGAK